MQYHYLKHVTLNKMFPKIIYLTYVTKIIFFLIYHFFKD